MSNPADDQLSAAPLSRREAREAAERATTTPAAPSSAPADTAAPVTTPVPARAVTAAVNQVPEAPAPVAATAAIAEDVVMTPAEADVPPARIRREDADQGALTDMADLFAAAPDAARLKKQDGRRRGKGCLIWLIILALIFGGLTAGGIYVNNVYGEQIREKLGMGEPKDYDASQTPGEETTVTIAEGDTGGVISQSLFDAGVTKTSDAFYDYLLGLEKQPDFYPGTYSIQTKLPSSVAATQLADPARKLENTALVREGLTAVQIFPILATALKLPEADVLAAAQDPSVYGVNAVSLEGWLFPATYTFEPGTTAQQAIQKMVDRTRQSLDAAGVPAERQEEILIIASIVQREGKEHDFGKVSRVIYNRLSPANTETFGYLQMDSTAQYAQNEMDSGVVFTSREALDDINAWNTYKTAGLPLTPIASPGDAAIKAAMQPDDGPWLYFVTVNQDTGETIFSNTNAEHEEAKKIMFAWCEANPDNKACGN